MQGEAHLRVGVAEGGDDVGQHIARLRVGGGEDELPLLAVGELLAELLDIARLDQNPLHDVGQFLAGLGQPQETLAAADEQLDAELVLQVLDVLGDARLGGVERIRYLGQVVVAAQRLADDAQLLEIHGGDPFACRSRANLGATRVQPRGPSYRNSVPIFRDRGNKNGIPFPYVALMAAIRAK